MNARTHTTLTALWLACIGMLGMLAGCQPARDADALAVLRIADRALERAQIDYQGGARFDVAGNDEQRQARMLRSRLSAIAASRDAIRIYLDIPAELRKRERAAKREGGDE